ncbi:hypothetical protein FALBO_11209 [Fusarium albosuccineum]|uniref:Uncharacterized protein n=1 Tax=Fusarium albosuccineum TaxID=1237068 RepID=A0A8H4PHZ9_9HYPO|nr:hypothetical protein FALBO_11209 [Fusarium albosuccineum]
MCGESNIDWLEEDFIIPGYEWRMSEIKQFKKPFEDGPEVPGTIALDYDPVMLCDPLFDKQRMAKTNLQEFKDVSIEEGEKLDNVQVYPYTIIYEPMHWYGGPTPETAGTEVMSTCESREPLNNVVPVIIIP